MKVYIPILFIVLISLCSCRKLVRDNPNDANNAAIYSASLKEGLIGFYPFNGNANDESGFISHGTNFGAISVDDRFGKRLSAYLFNGNDYIDLGINDLFHPANHDIFSINLWVKSDALDPGVIISKYINGNYEQSSFKLDLFPNSSLQLTGNGNSYFTIQANHRKWVNITIEIRPKLSSAKFFINGILVNSGIINLNLSGNLTPLILGGTATSASLERFFNGYLDDIRIYNRALTQEEITYLANN
jgi:hypothetical protein